LPTNFRNPPSPPFDKGGLGGFPGNSSLRQHSLFGSGLVGLGFKKLDLDHLNLPASFSGKKMPMKDNLGASFFIK
jgi:hypothetical protein